MPTPRCSRFATGSSPSARASTSTTRPSATRPRSPRSSSASTTPPRRRCRGRSSSVPTYASAPGLLAEALSERRGSTVRGASGRARRQAAPARAGRAQRPAGARPGPAAARAPPPAAGRFPVGAAGGVRDGGAAGPNRGLRHLQPRCRAHGRLDGRLRGRRDEESPLPALPGPRRRPRRRWGHAGDPHPANESLPRAGGPLPARLRSRRELRLAAGDDRDRRRQRPAGGRDAGAGAVRRAWSDDRQPCQTPRGGVRARSPAGRSTWPRSRRPRGSCSESATRPTASRSSTTAAAGIGR